MNCAFYGKSTKFCTKIEHVPVNKISYGPTCYLFRFGGHLENGGHFGGHFGGHLGMAAIVVAILNKLNGSIANLIKYVILYMYAKFGAFTMKCTIFPTICWTIIAHKCDRF